MLFEVFCSILFRSEEIRAQPLSEHHESWDVLGCHEQHGVTLGNLGMVQAFNVRCVQRTISRTTLLSTACLVQKGARHLMGPLRAKTANVKLANSSKQMESGHLIEEKVWLRLDFCHVWCCSGDAQFIVSETGQGALKEHRNGHHSNVCNNSKRITMNNSINQQKPNHFSDGTEFLQLPVFLSWLWDLHFGWGAVDAQLIKRFFKTVVYNARIYTWTVQHQVQPPSPLVHSRASPVWATRPGRLNVYPLKNAAMHQGRTIAHKQHWYLRAPKAMLVWCAWIVIPISMLLEGLAWSVKIMIWNFQILGYSHPSSW